MRFTQLYAIRVHDREAGRGEAQIEGVRAALERAGFTPVARLEREAGRGVVGLLGRRP